MEDRDELRAETAEQSAAAEPCEEEPAAETPAMTVKGLSFAYGEHSVLRGLSLEIPRGKITTIMGANGCGKTTLFSLMTKNLTPGKGKILLGKKNIRGLDLSAFARRVAIVHQTNSAWDDLTVEQLVAFGRTPWRKQLFGHSAEDAERVQWALAVTGLTPYADRELGRLSGGQRQRVWIAMALAQDTKILFLDEPTTYLDIRYQMEILQLIRRLNREFGLTIIMVLHDINQAIHFSDRVIGLKDGKVAVEGDPQEVITPEVIRELYDIRLEVTEIDGRKFVLV